MCGVLERIVYFNEENLFCIGEFRPEDARQTVTITGKLPAVQCGETLELSGAWSQHPKHGEQFKVYQYSSRLPSDVYGIRKYLGSGLIHGIGEVYANKIVDQFGKDTLNVISEASSRLREVPGIGKQRAHSIKQAWDEQAALRDVMMFLKTYGVGTAQCLKLVRRYGAQAQQILQNEPYRIAREVEQIGFKTADKIALNLGFANDGAARLEAAALHVVNEMETEGHTCVAPAELVAQTAELTQVHSDSIYSVLDHLTKRNELKYGLQEKESTLQSPLMHRAEHEIARAIQRLHETAGSLPPIKIDKAIEWAENRAGFTFASEQAQALESTLNHKLTILTGGPGTGKTTILQSLVAILKAKKIRISLAAPTGRAAQRMQETTRHFAQTLHRLLDFDASEGRFMQREDNPIKTDFVIVDEASMLDTRLAAALLRAIPDHAHVLLVGDIHQLPSVGPGNILKDFIHTECFQVVRLEKIFRQGDRSEIVSTAHRILTGDSRPPSMTSEWRSISNEQDLHFIKSEDPEECMKIALELAAKTIPATGGWDSIMDIQLLAPMHKGSSGISRFNLELQKHLNGNAVSITVGDQNYGVGDKIIQTRNDYDRNIYNGDIGRITSVDQTNGTLRAQFDNRSVDCDRAHLTDLQLAYAISIHKSQGSEFPVVILPFLKQHYIMLQRNLLYTAITRGRKKVFLVGDPVAYAMAVRHAESTHRQTDLLPKIQHALAR